MRRQAVNAVRFPLVAPGELPDDEVLLLELLPHAASRTARAVIAAELGTARWAACRLEFTVRVPLGLGLSISHLRRRRTGS